MCKSHKSYGWLWLSLAGLAIAACAQLASANNTSASYYSIAMKSQQSEEIVLLNCVLVPPPTVTAK